MKLCDMRLSLFVLAVERRASNPAARLHDNWGEISEMSGRTEDSGSRTEK